MTFPFEGETDLESLAGRDEEMFGDYEVAFEEEDFEALGINPGEPTDAKPGSEEKVLMLSARYSAGLPLWHDEDRYDHGPEQAENETGDELDTENLEDLEELQV